MARRRSKSALGVPAEAEALITDTAETVARDVEFLLEILMPDGRPFGMEVATEEEQIQQYLDEGLHDNEDACLNWIRTRVLQLVQLMTAFGLTPEEQAFVRPYDIVESAAIHWSAKMERLIAKREQRVLEEYEAAQADVLPTAVMPSQEVTATYGGTA